MKSGELMGGYFDGSLGPAGTRHQRETVEQRAARLAELGRLGSGVKEEAMDQGKEPIRPVGEGDLLVEDVVGEAALTPASRMGLK